MKSIIKIFGVIKSKLTLKLIWFIGLFILTSFTLWKVYSFFSFDNEVEQTSVSNISMANSLGELKTFLKLNKEDNLFTVGLPPIINVLFVNTKDKTLLYQPNTSENNVTIEYESVNSLIKKVKAGSEEIFDDLINTYFQIPNYSQFLSKKNNIPFIEIIQIGESIGADTGYLKQISDKGGNDIRTILLSLIYNTIYSGSNGHMATVIENQKLKSLNNKNYKIDIVNSKLLSESLTRLQSDSKNDRKKFIESEYRQYHPSDLTIEPDVSDNELQVNIEKLLQSKSIRLDASAPFDFLYINFRKDILYCGERAYPYNSSTLYAVDESNLDYLFTKQFAIPNYKSLATKEIVLQIGIPADTAKFPETNNDSQTSFIALLNYLLNNPSVYCINNGKLQSFQSIKNDSMLYGKFNRSMLQKAIDDLSQYNTNDSEYSIVKIDNVTPRVIYTTIFLLFLSYCILFFFYFVRQTSKEDIILELKGYFNEKLKSIKEEYEKLIVNSRKVTQEKTMIEITQYLTRPGLYLDYETPTLKAVRHKVIFYSEIEKSKNSANLIKILNIERTNNQNIPKVESANDIFDEVNKEKSRVDKITHLLDKFDEYSSNVSKEKEKLIEKFQEYKKAKNSMDNLNTLLKEEFKGDFFSHLKDHIIKIENNPSIKNFVRFGLLFKSSNHIKPKVESEILKVYIETNNFIDDFYRKYQKIDRVDLVSGTGIICWSIELANNLLKVRKASISIDIEKIKNNQLQLIANRFFIHNANNPNKTVDEFELSITESNERIAEYNNKIADSTSKLILDYDYSENINVLKDLIRKIKKYENSEFVFKKLYEHFIRNFLDKVKNLKFNEREVISEDRSWLFQQLFNIAFHTADYVEYFIKEDDIKYHSNFLFLKNNFDLTKTEHRTFIENDMEQSTRASNTIVKAARFAGVEKLDLLIDKYYIKPEQFR